MDRNTIYGILLIVAIIFTFSIFNNRNLAKNKQLQHTKDSIAALNQPTEVQPPVADTQTIKKDTASAEKIAIAAPVAVKDSVEQTGYFAQQHADSNEFISLENDLLRVKIATKGGRVYSTELLKYKTHDKKPLIMFDGDSTRFDLIFPTNNNRYINTGDYYFSPISTAQSVIVKDSSASVSLRLYADSTRYIEYTYTLHQGAYMLDFDISFVGLDSIMASNVNSLDLHWSTVLLQLEQGKTNENGYTSISYKYFQDEVENISPPKDDEKKETMATKLQWVAFKGQFFSSVLIAKNNFLNGSVSLKTIADSSKYLKDMSSDLVLSYKNSAKETIALQYYFGPNKLSILKQYKDLELKGLVSIGKNIVKWINQGVIIPVFNFLNQFILNYGIIILLLTIFIKILLLPLTYRSYLSMAKMRVLKPQIDEINNRISADKMLERQQATMALYKKAGVSPLGGCIPMLLQLPILYAMFRFFPTSIELRQESFLWAHDLSTYDSILTLPFTIPMYGSHVSLFTILMTISTIITMKISNQTANTTSQMPGMQTMMYIMPVMFMVFLNSMSAALTYYYFLANMITFGQNELFKLFVDDKEILKRIDTHKSKAPKKSKFQERLEQMAKQKGYKLPK